jgi:predicted transcriptional regulator
MPSISGAIEMRTTIEISDEHRARLMELAARRGEKGFSKLVRQALDAYLRSQTGDEEKRRRALMLKGALESREAARLREGTREIRESWR